MIEKISDDTDSSLTLLARLKQFCLKLVPMRFRRSDLDANLRETIEELIEEGRETEPSIESDERELLGNVLNLRELTAEDVMTPRADIVAASIQIQPEELITTMTKRSLTLLPVYRDTLDHVMGAIHIKDVMEWMQKKKPLNISKLIRPVLFVSPAMRTLDLLLKMRESGSKMALVVDEYGGIDGLITLSDLIEEIIGDIQDAHESHISPQFIKKSDSTILADARLPLRDILEKLGFELMIPDLDDDIDTLGGLIAAISGRVPSPGELINHPTGIEFEIIDADPRRIKRVCLRHVNRYRPLEKMSASDP